MYSSKFRDGNEIGGEYQVDYRNSELDSEEPARRSWAELYSSADLPYWRILISFISFIRISDQRY